MGLAVGLAVWLRPLLVPSLVVLVLVWSAGCSKRPASESAPPAPGKAGPLRGQLRHARGAQLPPGASRTAAAALPDEPVSASSPAAGLAAAGPAAAGLPAAGLPAVGPAVAALGGEAAAAGPVLRAPGASAPLSSAFSRSASRSVGTPQTGHLEGGVSLASVADPQLRFLARTAKNGTLWGTVELVALIRSAAAGVAREHPGAVLTVGNLSRRGGGDISASVSHNSGRDADLVFYLLDARGRSVRWPTMLHCDDSGVVRKPAKARGFRFDTARNWSLVRHLLSHPAVVVQWIFVAAPLRNMLLDHALRMGEPALLRQRARRVLVQPSDSSRHDDHFHVRIACPPGDRPACRSGPGRTRLARETQIDSLLHMYHHGSPAERRYAREILSVPVDGSDLVLPPEL